LRYEWLNGLATRKQKSERLFFERKFKEIASSCIYRNKYAKTKLKREHTTINPRFLKGLLFLAGLG